MSNEIKYYPLSESDLSVKGLEAYCGRNQNNCCILINFEDEIVPDIMEQAANEAIKRYPSAYTRLKNFSEDGQTVVKRYFTDHTDGVCGREEFDSDKKLYKFIKKFHLTDFPNDYQDCDLYRVALVRRENGHYGLLICVYHLVADAYGLMLLSHDTVSIYNALLHGSDMPAPPKPLLPAYEDMLETQKGARHEKAVAFWDSYWKNLPQTPNALPLTGFEDRSGAYIKGKPYTNFVYLLNIKGKQLNLKIPKGLVEKCERFSIVNQVSTRALFLLAMKAWLAKKSDRSLSFTIIDLVANRSKLIYKETSGNTIRGLAFVLDAPNEYSVIEACNYTMRMQGQNYRYPNLTQAEREVWLRKRMGMKAGYPIENMWVQSTASTLFTFQPYVDLGGYGIRMSMERFPTGKSPYPLYITVMPTDSYSGELNVNYEYMTKIYSENDLRAFHEYMLRFLHRATSDPKLTLNELIDME